VSHAAPSGVSPIREIRIADWDAFNRYCDDRDGWAFRGQSDATWPLLSSLSRRLRESGADRGTWGEREERAIRIFRRKAHIYLDDHPTHADDLRWLALMQHHGAPTRLLDFTKSPYVAAFFALEDAVGDAAVYALNTPALWSAAPAFDRSLTRDRIDPREPGNYERCFVGNRLPVVWFGEPSVMDRRLVAQSGLFVVPGRIDLPLGELLDGYAAAQEAAQRQPLLVKYVLPQAMRSEAMQSLYRMNVTNASLFPDLEGLARAAAYELEVVWERLVEDFRAQDVGAKDQASP